LEIKINGDTTKQIFKERSEKEKKVFDENLETSVDGLAGKFAELRTSSDIYKLKYNIVSYLTI
jgi:hypothetical protein